MPAYAPLADRLAAKLVPAPGGCLLWTGATDRWGYGMISTGLPEQRTIGTHRAAFLVGGGQLEPGELVLHSCDTPSCCALEHLRAGTHAQNMRDRSARRRCAHKLTADDVRELRRAHSDGASYSALAAAYSISAAHVSRLVRGTRQPHA